MKKAILLASLFALPAVISFSMTKPSIAYAVPDEESEELSVEESGSEPIDSEESNSAEESKKGFKDIEEIEKYIEEIKNKQFMGTTIGAIAATAASLLVSFGFSLLNRHNILQTRNLTDTTRGYVGDVSDLATNIKSDYLKIKEELSANKTELVAIKDSLKEQIKDNIELKKIIEEERSNFLEEKRLLLTLISSSKELVANGKAEEVFKRYGL